MDLRNCRDFISLLSIRTKEGELVPLRMNAPQRRFYEAVAERYRAGKPVRVIVLKARQEGFSTLTEAILFWATVTAANSDALVIAHKEDATANLFRMTKLYYDTMPEELRPMRAASNAQELVFDRPAGAPEGAEGLRSRIRCATAGGTGVGRSDTLRCVHMSEIAFWPGDKLGTYAGIMQAVPDLPGTIVVIESTANGFNAFKDLWDAAVAARERGDEDGMLPLFFPWYEFSGYRREPAPGFRRTEEEEKLASAFGLDDGQLAWRRWCIRVNCGGDEARFRQEYPATPDEAFVSTGSCVFDKNAVSVWRETVRRTETPERGIFRYTLDETREPGKKITDIRFEPDGKGIVRILRRPEPRAPYVIGGDTAGTGSDRFTGQVLDNRTGEQAAVLQHDMDERLYATQMYCLGKYYNDALIGVETNYSTYPEMELERLGYRHLYVRERVDTFDGGLKRSYGFETTARTRPLIIDGLKDVARTELSGIRDWETLGEMLTFVYTDDWRPQADEGYHDDLVMALAIAHYIRGQQRTDCSPEAAGDRSGWTEDMWEDWRHADAAGKRHLENVWSGKS